MNGCPKSAIVCLGVMLFATVGSECARAQTAGQYASTVSKNKLRAPIHNVSFPGASTDQPENVHLPARAEETSEAENLRKLEENAGEDAGKVLIRSSPSEARLWVDDLFVGKTPLLLILAPGRYQVKLRTSRGDSAEEHIAVLPREDQEIVIRPRARYPAQIRLQ